MTQATSHRHRSTGKLLTNAVFSAVILLGMDAGITSATAQSTEPASLSGQLDGLDEPVRQAIDQKCLPVQYSQGAQAYRECVLDTLQSQSANDMAQFEALSFDEKYAVQQACRKDRRSPDQPYHRCLVRQVAESSLLPAPDLTDISDDEHYVLQQSCFQAQTQGGAAAYRQCINDEIFSLKRVPAVDLSALSSLDRNAIQIGCSPARTTSDAAEYRRCLSRELLASGLTTGASSPNTSQPPPSSRGLVTVSTLPDSTPNITPEPIVGKAPREPQSASTDAAATTTGSTQDSSSGASSGFANDSAVTVIVNNTLDATTDPIVTTGTNTLSTIDQSQTSQPGADSEAATATDKTTAAVSDPDRALNYWLYAAPLLVLLAALQGLYLLLKRRSAATTIDRELINPPIDFDHAHPAGTSPDATLASVATPSHWQFDDWKDFSPDAAETPAATLDNTLVNEQWSIDSMTFDNTGNHTMAVEPLPTTQVTDTLAEELDQTLVVDNIDARAAVSPAQPVTEPATRSISARSDFGRQLEHCSEPERKQQATEFLLYWVSYGDGNIDPARAAQLLNADTQNEHDLIKRWVLQKDAQALTDALQFLRATSSDTAMRQTLTLLLCLLVKSEITPLQNTFFRFFADVAGVGTDGLQRLYRSLFGKMLPAMPRTDSVNWWHHHHSENIPNRSELADLGLPDNPTRQQIQAQLGMVNYRFNAAHFDQLGEKEQRLVQRHGDRCRELLVALAEEQQ